jgi:hypothetical protein
MIGWDYFFSFLLLCDLSSSTTFIDYLHDPLRYRITILFAHISVPKHHIFICNLIRLAHGEFLWNIQKTNNVEKVIQINDTGFEYQV